MGALHESLDDASNEAGLLLFGSQVESLTKQSLDEIRQALADGPSREWILKTVGQLPAHWDALAKAVPEVAGAAIGNGATQPPLKDLQEWVQRGPGDEEQGGLFQELDAVPSVVLSPLVVLTQLVQYQKYLRSLSSRGQDAAGTDAHAELVVKRKTPTLGFCMGLVSAFAVASARTSGELYSNGAVAVRLAMVGGALIDAQDGWNKKLGLGPSKAFATAWRDAAQRQEMDRIINGMFPEAYVSVLYDEARATVSTSERAASRLVRQLRAAGITVAEVGFRGDIHSLKPETTVMTDALFAFCNATPDLRLPGATRLVLPSYTNEGDGKPLAADAGPLHEIVLRAVFAQRCDWYGTFTAVKASCLDANGATKVVAFGPDRCVPPTLVRQLGPKHVHFADLPPEAPLGRLPIAGTAAHQTANEPQSQHLPPAPDYGAYDESAIAVVGMSIKVAGADDVDEFSQMLKTGKSQHEIISPDRMAFESLFRDGQKDPSRKWYANFMRDADSFDHKFFKRSPRESASMDPQQRLLLQAAYQAVEQAGYFTDNLRSSQGGLSEEERGLVGVYIGSPAVDYEHNVACHEPNAFTATGNLQSFLAGRVAHWFGWTGPALVLDTACSSSAVAIHSACRSLLSGECNAALAGGVALCTNPLWFQNLAAASFLSPTGQCKPFDSQADGFCRAEGIACVFLKRMKDAVADGNPIFGCISSSAVYQNRNSTPMFVPNSPSLAQLFKDVLRQAKVQPGDISLVEAHGTGTPVGDPAEYDAIREAVGGSEIRSKPVPIGSVKGHVGHAEGASGVVSLIKVLTMMRENYIPPQASFSKLNPGIKASPSDMMEIVTSLRPWSDSHDKKVLLNNYGACGSNAAMVVTQFPFQNTGAVAAATGDRGQAPRLPFCITGLDARSIKQYAARLLAVMKSDPAPALADVSFNLNRHGNPALSQKLLFTSRSVAELCDTLSEVVSGSASASIQPSEPERPVILCFGGQVSTFVGLDRKLYDGVAALRHHLDECDAIMQSGDLGLDSIYPAIFSRAPGEDPVRVQTTLFAMQYACARTWLDCGLSGKVAAVVGHSFGELTALCISGALSLRDTIRLVARRARLVRDAWGPDKGSMMAVEADLPLVEELLAHVADKAPGKDNSSASIACYNGPRSFTLAGPEKAIDAVAETMSTVNRFSSIRYKRLGVTNAFHSTLVDTLLAPLEEIGKDLDFREPTIPLERASETESGQDSLTSSFVSEHMRQPVFFNHAIQRLIKKYPSAVFLEAGSSSTITVMASRAVSSGRETLSDTSHHFQAVNITNDKALDGLTDVTVSLWKAGVRVSFWPHHSRQYSSYSTVLLPPYQFEKSKHWMDMKSSAEAVAEAVGRQNLLHHENGQLQTTLEDERTLGLWTFVGYGDQAKRKGKKDNSGCPRFRINTGSDKYREFISGHIIAETAPICPGTLQVDMAIEALFTLFPMWKSDGLQPVVHDMVNHSPLCVDPTLAVWLNFDCVDVDNMVWDWNISSTSRGSQNTEDGKLYVQGRLHIRSPTDAAYLSEFSRFERLVSHASSTRLLMAAGRDGDLDVLQGRNVYRAFTPFVDYANMYRGVRTVVGRETECAGRVVGQYSGATWVDVTLDDSFSQIAGIWVNCMTDAGADDVYIANGIEMSMRSPRGLGGARSARDTWDIYVRNTRQSEGYLSDVFVFDAGSGELVEVMLGIRYSRTSRASMSRLLSLLTKDKSLLRNTKRIPGSAGDEPVTADGAPAPSLNPQRINTTQDHMASKETKKKKSKQAQKDPGSGLPDVTTEVRKLVATVAGMDAADITLDTEVADIGIDSLMGMELAREVNVAFSCSMDQATLLEATSVRQLVEVIAAILPTGGSSNEVAVVGEEGDDDSSTDDDDWSNISTGDGAPTPLSVPGTGSATPNPPKALTNPATLELQRIEILDSFAEVKVTTDQRLLDSRLNHADRDVIAPTSRLCAVLIVEAFEKLGCSLRTLAAGDHVERVSFQPEYSHFVNWLYRFLETDARLLDKNDMNGQLVRTAIPAPTKSSKTILEELLQTRPDWGVTAKLIYHAGKPLAEILSGETDGIRVLFGSADGRDLMAGHYRSNPFAAMLGGQMRDFLGALAMRTQKRGGGRLKILELGAGTGGTTLILVPFLASLNIDIEYTFTDLSASMVAQARRTIGKQYPFMRFAVQDIEKPASEELRGQHVIVASNAVHATHNLVTSASHIRDALLPDGVLMMLEQTEDIPLSNLIFGLFEGWWLFDDGRTHAVVPTENWERDLHAAGYGHVDWTDGHLIENKIQRVIIALASGPSQTQLPISAPIQKQDKETAESLASRVAIADGYLAKYISAWETTALSRLSGQKRDNVRKNNSDNVVVVTGATGSLGSHLVAAFAEQPDVKAVVCVNRRSTSTPIATRQADAFSNRGISLSPAARSKLRILETDTSQPRLGLAAAEYDWLVEHGTHIVHNAWPMSGTRPLTAFEPQLQTMRNLLDLARDMASRATCADDDRRIGFQLVSSIGVVGHAGRGRIPEDRVALSSVLPTGYCQGKWICERMLDETLHKFPSLFRPMVVRPGQIAGSSTSGVWNPVEHFAFIVKSAQAVRAWPDLEGTMQWIPVDEAAAGIAELLYIGNEAQAPEASPIYHIDNPAGQRWKDMTPVLADALGIPKTNILPYRDWLRRICRVPLPETDNPAVRLFDFLENDFERMSCGGLTLDTSKSQEHSKSLAAVRQVSPSTARNTPIRPAFDAFNMKASALIILVAAATGAIAAPSRIDTRCGSNCTSTGGGAKYYLLPNAMATHDVKTNANTQSRQIQVSRQGVNELSTLVSFQVPANARECKTHINARLPSGGSATVQGSQTVDIFSTLLTNIATTPTGNQRNLGLGRLAYDEGLKEFQFTKGAVPPRIETFPCPAGQTLQWEIVAVGETDDICIPQDFTSTGSGLPKGISIEYTI
ncbi:Conidial yellow pigment biosynthesis polyketide synthase [Purpureocillium lavendulum]|uniref:Conidial yellow pigment biosynthesis polyketide synthase n=1 Tax=Purpureocillium lavendulum TaxID=1247861 RepID=A0AB34FYH1_9HYPO|nr:Conidial yellow pigment biosynthesis polyketide synthase [Purpureocillium lavendulum]